MNNPIKLIALDLDGTLLNNKKQITPRTQEALRRCHERGILCMPATGRPATGFPDIAAQMPGFRYALTSNGALVYDYTDKCAVYEDLLSIEHTLEILEFAKNYDVMTDIYTNGNGYSTRANLANVGHYFFAPGMIEYVLKTRIPVDDMREFVLANNRPVEKIVLFFGDLSLQAILEKDLKRFPYLRVTDALENNLELNNVTANKGASLLRFGEMMGIRREETMACGDGRNDCDMVAAAGIGVGMENACDELKVVADVITTSNEDDGVARAIEKYALV